MPGGRYLGPYYLGQPPQTFPCHIKANILAGAALAVLTMIAKNAPQQQPLETLKTQGLLLTRVRGYRAHPGSHSEVMGREQRGHSNDQSSGLLKGGFRG